MPPTKPAFASLYGWDDGAQARAQDCGDCEALRARDAYAVLVEEERELRRAIALGRADLGWAEPRALATERTDPSLYRSEWRTVELYSGYPIDEEEAAALADVEPLADPIAF
jgi:hypothetical protein